MDKKSNYDKLRAFAEESGVAAFGVCEFKEKKGFGFAVSVAIRLSKGVLDEIEDRPTKLYFHHYRQANNLLDQTAMRIANFIQNRGYNALPVPASQIVDWEKQTAYLSHKAVAESAGIGWLGRNNLIVHPEFGSQIRLVTVLTDMPLSTGAPLKKDCSSCKACVEVCPASAIKTSREDFDHMVCFEKLKFFQKQRFADQYICGICVKACRGGDPSGASRPQDDAFGVT